MENQKYNALDVKIDKIIDILKGENGDKRGLCEKVRDCEDEIKGIKTTCKKNHENKIKKWGPLVIQACMFVAALMAIFFKTK